MRSEAALTKGDDELLAARDAYSRGDWRQQQLSNLARCSSHGVPTTQGRCVGGKQLLARRLALSNANVFDA
jgi:hypothetical protein